MKDFSILIQFRFVYVYMLIYVVIGYFYDSYLKRSGVYSFLSDYFGLAFFIIILLAIMKIYYFFIKCNKKKMVYNIRMFFLYVLIICVIFLWFMYSLDIPFKKQVASSELLEKSIEMILYKKKFGLIVVFIFDWLISKVQFFYLYIIFYLLSFLSFFFIGAKSIRRVITKIIETRRLKKKMEADRKALQEQIRLMELLEEKGKIKK